MNDAAAQSLAALADHLSTRRDVILAAWRSAVENDPHLETASILSRNQFNDHIPSVLSAFERKLCAAGEAEELKAAAEQKEHAAEHGLNRWQHGYDLEQVMREWGHLQLCLLNELEDYALAHPGLEYTVMLVARRELAQLCSAGVTESAVRYSRLQQLDAAGRLQDLETALDHLRNIERERAEMWREAAHDLRGKVQVVHSVAELLSNQQKPDLEEDFVMLQQSVASLHALLSDLAALSRLEAGHEKRRVESFDAAAMLADLCAAAQPMAQKRNLFLKHEGPAALSVEGDAVKIRRIAENLVFNAISYTEHGGVKVAWHALETGGTERWELVVHDTGPGLEDTAIAPLAQALKEATAEAHGAKGPSADATLMKAFGARSDFRPQSAKRPGRQGGEGIGLAIVKRLCELLDATMELETESGKGSTFRVIFPRRYSEV